MLTSSPPALSTSLYHTKSNTCKIWTLLNPPLSNLYVTPILRSCHRTRLMTSSMTSFGNILDLRETSRHLLEVMYVRQREEGPIIQREPVGDLFLSAVTEFRYAYPTYIGHLPVSEKRLKEELELNIGLRQFLEVRDCPESLSATANIGT